MDLRAEIKDAVRKGKSNINIKGKQYSINDAIAMDTFMNGGYKKYNDGGGKSKAKKATSKNQPKNEYNLYGTITPEQLEQTKQRNPWYDWNSFDGSPESVRDFQQSFNSLVREGHKIGVDGNFGEETQSAHLESFRPQIQSVNELDSSMPRPIMQMEVQTPDGMWIPKVGSWDVTESVVNPSGFGSHTKTYKTTDQNYLDQRRRVFDKDRATQTGRNNSLQASPNYTGTQVFQQFADGGYKKYMNGGDPPTDNYNVTETPEYQWWHKNTYHFNPDSFDPFKTLTGMELPPATQGKVKTDMGEGYERGQIGTPKQEQQEEETTTDQMRTFNPYAGVDIPSAAAFLGQGIERGGLGGAGLATAAGAKLGLGVARNILGGMGRERTMQDQIRKKKETDRSNMEGRTQTILPGNRDGGYFEMGGIMPAPMQAAYEGMNYYEDGGQMPEERVLTGEFMEGISENNQNVQPNSELEDGEYIHSQDGSSIKVEGKTHEQGGEEMELQEGDRVISNNLKLKGDNAKQLRNQFDIKVKATDTYAKAVDKIYKQIGLSKLIEEEESILKRLKNTDEDIEDETTRDLNKEFLSKKLQEIQQKKEELEPQRQQALETVFELQELSKPESEQADNDMFEDGGIKTLSERYNISMERAKELIEEFKNGGYKKYSTGGFADRLQEMLEDALKKSGYTDEELIGFSEALDKIPEGQSKKILKDLGIEVYGNVTASQVLETVQKNPWYDWDKFDGSKASVKDFQEEYNKRVGAGGKLKVDGKFGEQTQSAYLPWLVKEPSLEEEAQTQAESPAETQTEPAPEGEDDPIQKAKTFVDIPMTPSQDVLPPSGMASQLNIQRRYDRVSPETISAEALIVENRRQANEAIQATQDLPPAQRAAAIAQINSNLQQANNQAMSQVEMQNAQIRNQAQIQNAQIQQAEENMRATDALSYEQRQQTAQALTEENVRQYYDYLRKINNARFNETVTRNTLNQLSENFNIDSLGNIQKTGEGITQDQAQQIVDLSRVQGVMPSTQAETKKKKKYGGKYKKKK